MSRARKQGMAGPADGRPGSLGAARALAAGDGGLALRARMIAASARSGRHRGAGVGASTEFFDFRAASAADPARLIDARVLARTDRAYVRRFEHRARLDVVLVVDASASMAFAGWGGRGSGSGAGAGATKLWRAQEVAAALALIAVRQGDRVGLVVAREGQSAAGALAAEPGTELSAGGRAAEAVIAALERVEAGAGRRVGASRSAPVLGEALARAGAMLARGGLMVVLSDGLEDCAALARALERVRGAGGQRFGGGGSARVEVVFVQILTRAELELRGAGPGPVEVRDPEGGAAVRVEMEAALSAYRGAIEAQLGAVRSAVERGGGRWVLARAEDESASVLERLLSRAGA